ncbi:MAG TPA: S1 RNA-binding domain-containing protein [Acidimicrobiales bacterium]|nr:S1 RNA-binding domain-containing protein [Acidimicrobiales bacterium]
MQAVMPMKHVVIDGSNIATEGRDTPSLAQLDEAVRAFIEEYSPEVVTVVVDATFPNRIEASERRTYEDAVAANELITPPAGAIGRGDAFVLQIARKADAAILSNDSFQEFHGDYPWLFEPGRLIGGKPVPHVGWVFMERVPVRGPASRRSVSEARKAIKAAKVSKASKVLKKASKAAAAEQPPEAAQATEPAAKAGGRKRRPSARGAAGDGTGARPPEAAKAGAAAAGAAAAGAPGDGQDDGQRESASNRAAKDVSPYNEALPFIEFIADHPVGSEVEAIVERFSSHGAYVLAGDARGYVPLRNLAHHAPRSAREVLNLGERRRFVVIAVDAPRRGIDLALPGVVAVPAAPEAPVAAQVVEALGMADAPAPAKESTARKAKAAASAAGTKRAAAKKAVTKAAAAKKAATKAGATAKRTAKKAPAKETVVKKSAAKAAAGKPAGSAPAARKAPAGRRAPARKAATRKAASKQAPAKAPTKKATATATTKRAAAKKAPKQ